MAVWAVTLIFVLSAFSQSSRVTTAKVSPQSDVLLITIDTLRADHVGAYGFKNAQTPTIDGLARTGVLFEHAYSQVPLTLASHTSLLTGTYPFHNGVQDFTGQPLSPDIRSVAQALQAKGYDTAAIVSSYVLDRSWGLNRGFSLYYDVFKGSSFLENDPGLVERKAGGSVDEALKWLRQNRSKPFFLWLHLYDPHSGYEPPEPFRTRFIDSPYDGEIAYADRELGRVIAYLKQRGLYDRTLIILASDHGESLGEHGEKEHGFFVYHSTLHVPLVVKPPLSSGIRAHHVSDPVPIMGIAPTILATLKLHDPIQQQFETESLLATGSSNPAPVYSESFYSFSSFGWSPVRTINNRSYQFIEAPKPELYDVRNDPEEKQNLIAEQPAVGSVLDQELKNLVLRYAPPGESAAGSSQLDAEAVEKLRALGYMAYRSPVSAEALAAGLSDPKDKILDFNTLLDGVDAGKRGELDLERKLLTQVQESNPGMYLIPFLLGEAELKASDWKAAQEALERSLKLNPSFDQAMTALARAFHQQGKDEEALQWVEKAIQSNPKNLRAWYQKGWISVRANPDSAMEAFEKALEIQPGFAMAHRDLGIILLQKGRYNEAATHLKQAADLGLAHARLYNFLGIAYSRTGRYRDAVKVYTKALDKEPGFAEAHLNLSYVYEKLNRPQSARLQYETACKLQADLCQFEPGKAQ
ncbi:MAG TPA: sulfatase-like hydrolase/transferase [Candidatus Sulfotelmatobacter sp.]|nr:sulfatase-like hydrolase/transferase [Candidatus Sulfotelmatobacter sp.]